MELPLPGVNRFNLIMPPVAWSRVSVCNLDDGIEIELVGEITNMIKTAQTANLKGKAASEEAASLNNYRSSVKVVAGVGFEPTTFRL